LAQAILAQGHFLLKVVEGTACLARLCRGFGYLDIHVFLQHFSHISPCIPPLLDG